jgi:hypothetical protein
MHISLRVLSLLAFAASSGMLACASATERSMARRAPDCCEHQLHFAQSASEHATTYRVLDRVNVSCPWLDPRRCRRMLLERACARDAEVVVLSQDTMVGLRGPAQITLKALLVRFEPARPEPPSPK